MRRVIGIVQSGRVILPPEARLADGTRVLVEWDDEAREQAAPLEREPWTEEEVRKEIEQARTLRGDQGSS